MRAVLSFQYVSKFWERTTGPVRLLGKLGSRPGPPMFRGRQFSKINIERIIFGNETTLAYFLILVH